MKFILWLIKSKTLIQGQTLTNNENPPTSWFTTCSPCWIVSVFHPR